MRIKTAISDGNIHILVFEKYDWNLVKSYSLEEIEVMLNISRPGVHYDTITLKKIAMAQFMVENKREHYSWWFKDGEVFLDTRGELDAKEST